MLFPSQLLNPGGPKMQFTCFLSILKSSGSTLTFSCIVKLLRPSLNPAEEPYFCCLQLRVLLLFMVWFLMTNSNYKFTCEVFYITQVLFFHTCFSWWFRAASSCANTISLSAVICTLSLSASSSSSIRSAFCRNDSWDGRSTVHKSTKPMMESKMGLLLP